MSEDLNRAVGRIEGLLETQTKVLEAHGSKLEAINLRLDSHGHSAKRAAAVGSTVGSLAGVVLGILGIKATH